MLILVQRSSGKSFNWRRAATGIRIVCACLSIASSTIRAALGIISTDPPRFRAPTTTVPPRVFLLSRAPQRATKTGSPRPAPALSESMARIWTENSSSRGLRSPTSSFDRVYRFCSPTLTLSRNAGGVGWLRILTPLPRPQVTSTRYRPAPVSPDPGLAPQTCPGGNGSVSIASSLCCSGVETNCSTPSGPTI